jgi:hypothetical protein
MRTFTKFVNQNAAAFGMCLTVLMAMETTDYLEHELTLQLQSIFLLSPLCVLLLTVGR